MNRQIKVTIVMPSLNVKPYIRECVDSVVNQTLKDIEIICVDAGSTDGTLEVLEEYAAQDHRITIIHSDKKSYGYQVNLGIDAAHGEYIGIVETDDYIDPDMYRALTEVADREQVDVLKADFHSFIHEGQERVFTLRPAVRNKDYYNKVLDPFQDNDVIKCEIVPSCAVYRTSFLREKHVRLNESAGASFQDNGLWWQVFTQAHRVMFLNQSFYRLRRDNPNSSVKSPGKVYCMCEEYDFMRDFLRMHPDLEARFASLLALYRMRNYLFTLDRIAPEFKQAFVKRFAQDFRKIKADGELDRALYTKDQWAKLQRIMAAPELFYFCRYNRFGNFAVRALKKIHGGVRYFCRHNRFGNFAVRALKKIHGGVRCLRDHGLRYTIDRGLFHLRLKADKGMGSDYEYYSNLPPSRYPGELKRWYKRMTGKKLNLSAPRTFNEKMQWMKLYDATPLKTKLADKYLVREWVKEKIGEEYLVPLLGVWDSFDEIDFDALPGRFVLKANHGSGWNIIVKDKSTFDREAAKAKFDVWMKTNFAFKAGFKMHYLNIPPKIIAEKYIENADGDLYDYKVWCFNGRAEYIMFLTNRKHGLLMDFYDRDWNFVPITYNYPNSDKRIPKPDNLKEMIDKAEALAQGFPHVRVDFYRTNEGRLLFGEMTFTSCSGVCKWNPPETDLMLGKMFELPGGK